MSDCYFEAHGCRYVAKAPELVYCTSGLLLELLLESPSVLLYLSQLLRRSNFGEQRAINKRKREIIEEIVSVELSGAAVIVCEFGCRGKSES